MVWKRHPLTSMSILVKVSEDLCDQCGSLYLTRLMSQPATFQSKLTGVTMCKHMDDGVLVGSNEALDRTLIAMGKVLLLKTSCPQLGSETKFLGSLLIKTERGFLVKPLAKLFDSLLLSCAGLEKCNPVHSPGVRSESRLPDEKPLLDSAEHSLYRTIVGKLMFIAAERPDIQFCVKECARGVQSPSSRDMQRAMRICRYLMGTREWSLKLEPWKDVDTLQVVVDSDGATDKVGRRSTSAGVAQLGGCTISTYSRTQYGHDITAHENGSGTHETRRASLLVCQRSPEA